MTELDKERLIDAGMALDLARVCLVQVTANPETEARRLIITSMDATRLASAKLQALERSLAGVPEPVLGEQQTTK